MAARSNVDELRDELDRLGQVFIGKVHRLISQGKESLRTYEIQTSPIYEQAVNFLKQPFPESLAARASYADVQGPPPSYEEACKSSNVILRPRTRYQTKCSDDKRIPLFNDVKLLSGRLVVVVDKDNYKVKLFSLEGQHIDSLKVDYMPYHLAVMDPTASDIWRIAVSVPGMKKIIMMEVTPVSIKRSSSIRMSGKCLAITAVDSSTLAVGYWWDNPGIDLINTNGDVLRSLCGGITPMYMSLTKDGSHIIMSTLISSLAKVRLEDGTVVYEKKVQDISEPWGVAPLQDGRCVVVDWAIDSLHLINRDGGWERRLWKDHMDRLDSLRMVCERNGVCVAGTRRGSLFVFDLF